MSTQGWQQSARHVRLVFVKELRETLRDRRTLLGMILFPLVIYPLLALLSTQVTAQRESRLEEKPARVGLPDAARAESTLATDVRELATHQPKRYTLVEDATVEDIQTERIDVFVRPAKPVAEENGSSTADQRIEILHDSARESSRRAESRLAGDLEAILPPGCVVRYAVSTTDLATGEQRGGYLLSRILPLLVVLMLMLGAFYPAIDATAGERERGTLETTLVAPIERHNLLLGKVLSVSVIAIITGMANLISMALTFVHLVSMVSTDTALPVPWSRMAIAAVGMVPSAFLFSSLLVAIASITRSFKEAQNLLTPVYSVFLVPAVAVSLGDYDLSPALAVIPGVNITLLLRDLIMADASALSLLLVLGSTAIYAALAMRLAAYLFNAERLLSVADPNNKKKKRRVLSNRPLPDADDNPILVPDAFMVFSLAFLLFVGSMQLQQAYPTVGLLLTQWVGLLGLPVIYVRIRGLRPSTALGWRRPTGQALAGGALMGAGAWVLAGFLAEWIAPPPEAVLEQLKDVLLAQDKRPFLLTFFMVAITPAVCEEMLFRGPILRGLLRGFPPAIAIAISAGMFSLFHFNLYRLVPTFALGLMLGWLAWRTGSVVPGMVAHLLNNGIVLVISAMGAEAALDDLSLPFQLGMYAGAILLVLAGIWVTRCVKSAISSPDGLPKM